ncbi:hypothetical protein L7F22_030235 [Adiantum nelumboides]|nr:hypothetical protein [Adiantum nelumboides]
MERTSKSESGLASHTANQVDSDNYILLSLQDLKWLQTITSLPILVKGILTAEDTKMALQYTAAGIIVSNHGARQLDYVPATINVLEEQPRERSQCSGWWYQKRHRCPQGAGLGSFGVFVGRPVVFSLAVDGEAGLKKMLDMLRDELELAMSLAGCTSLKDITRAHVKTKPEMLQIDSRL